MSVDTGQLAMTIFLLISACFNLPFFARSIRDVLSPTRFQSMPAAPSALLTTALAELSWVLPCFVQCTLQTFRGNGPWSPSTSRLGCDVMGFYSVFGSVLGMTSTVWVAVITHRAVTGRTSFSAKIGVLTNVALVLGSALFCALPFLGVGSFVYAGEGVSWLSSSHARSNASPAIMHATRHCTSYESTLTPAHECAHACAVLLL